MKKLALFIALFCASLITMAQDVIVMKDGSTIQSKVMEINGTEIKYKKWSNLDGPMYSISRNEVNSINYQNGEVELITTVTPSYPAMYANGRMERDGKNLTLDGRELSDGEVRQLVGEENYQTYLSAQKQIGLGRTYTYMFFGSLGASAVLSIVYMIEGSEPAIILSAVATGLVANASFPLMLVFNNAGKGRMNWVADEFNRIGKANAFSWQLSPSIMKCNSMESQNNLGLGLTFSVNF